MLLAGHPESIRLVERFLTNADQDAIARTVELLRRPAPVLSGAAELEGARDFVAWIAGHLSERIPERSVDEWLLAILTWCVMSPDGTGNLEFLTGFGIHALRDHVGATELEASLARVDRFGLVRLEGDTVSVHPILLDVLESRLASHRHSVLPLYERWLRTPPREMPPSTLSDLLRREYGVASVSGARDRYRELFGGLLADDPDVRVTRLRPSRGLCS